MRDQLKNVQRVQLMRPLLRSWGRLRRHLGISLATVVTALPVGHQLKTEQQILPPTSPRCPHRFHTSVPRPLDKDFAKVIVPAGLGTLAWNLPPATQLATGALLPSGLFGTRAVVRELSWKGMSRAGSCSGSQTVMSQVRLKSAFRW